MEIGGIDTVSEILQRKYDSWVQDAIKTGSGEPSKLGSFKPVLMASKISFITTSMLKSRSNDKNSNTKKSDFNY